MSLLTLGFGGLLDWPQIAAGLALLPGVAIGLLIGPVLRRRISRQRARLAVLVTSAASALVLFFH